MRTQSTVSIRVAAALGLVVAMAIAACSRPAGGPFAQPSASPPTTTAPAASPMTAPAGAGAWRVITKAPIPLGYYTSAWTGSDLVIHAPSFADPENPVGSTDAAYNPATDAWRRLPSSGYPVLLIEGGFRLAWTGSELLAFGMMDAAYSPATNSWRPLPRGPAGASATVWTGRQLLMWGGGCCGSSTADGSAFDVARGVWEPMPTAPLAPRHAPGVWTGTEMIVVGGADDASTFADAAAYNPTTHAWRKLAPMPAPVSGETLTWTGTEVLVVGGARAGTDGMTVSAAALAYNPSTDTWRRLTDMPWPRYQHVAAWTGDQLLVWGGTRSGPGPTGAAAPPNGVAYDPMTDRWSSMPTSPLKARADAISAWTGTELIIWGGVSVDSPTMFGDGAVFRPARSGSA